MAQKMDTKEDKIEIKEEDNEKKVEVKKTVDEVIFDELYQGAQRVNKGATTQEPRLVQRVIRKIFTMKPKIRPSHFFKLLSFLTDVDFKAEIESLLSKIKEQKSAEMDTTDDKPRKEESKIVPLQASLEISLVIYLFAVVLLLDDKQFDEAAKASLSLIERVKKHPNRTSVYPISAKAYFYYARSFELINKAAEIRSNLLASYKTASLRHDAEGQITLLNLILRNYLQFNLVENADKFLSKITLPKEGEIGNNQMARFLYYQGKIKSIQLEYTKAENCLSEAIRKAPTTTALGFKLMTHKLLCIVQLLIGEIPERRIFRQQGMEKALEPYLRLTKAVRIGDLEAFHNVVRQYETKFTADHTISLIRRLRNNVIKTGLRKINIAYSRISFLDICDKLKLESPEDAEYIVAKSIKDGVIDATIDRKGGFLQSNETPNVYSTYEPSEAFHKRIEFTLNMRNEAIKSMRYIDQAEKNEVLITNEERTKREEAEKKKREEEEKKEEEENKKKGKEDATDK